MFPETFETERLTYRRLCSETIGPLELYDLTSSRSSTAMEEFQYLPWDPAETVKEAADRLDAFEQKWDDRERADALLEIAFERLDFGVVAIPLHGENQKSYRAVEKYVQRHGGRYEGLLRNHAARYDGPADHHRFSIIREEYEASK
jgi:RimJ/RimL family protein N-acetyltransferase